ncbi:MAG: hypothetical protein EOP84_07255 [Verrucomicrobiaceae bacterium]|nr:MAG: hypothetical protein EOP84_07255 [Verrucomicrobiaceae bacterium]
MIILMMLGGPEQAAADAFIEFCEKSGVETSLEYPNDMLAIRSAKKALVLSHPLWHTSTGLWQPAQIAADKELRAAGFTSEFVDVREFTARPALHYLKLQA